MDADQMDVGRMDADQMDVGHDRKVIAHPEENAEEEMIVLVTQGQMPIVRKDGLVDQKRATTKNAVRKNVTRNAMGTSSKKSKSPALRNA